MFARQRDPGLWTFDSVVEDFEFEIFDENLSNAIDGNDGGAYSLQDNLTIGGAPGVNVTLTLPFLVDNDVTVGGDFNAYGDSFLGGEGADTITMIGHTLLHGSLTEIGATGSDALVVNAFTDFNDIVTFDGVSFFNDDVTIVGDLEADGHHLLTGVIDIGTSGSDALTVDAFTSFNDIVNFDGEINCADDINCSANIRFTSNGAIVHRYVLGGDANASYSPRSVHEVVVLDGSLTASRTYTINDTDCVDGQEITFTNKDQTHALVILKPDATNLGSNTGWWKRCKRIAGTWQLVQEGDVRA